MAGESRAWRFATGVSEAHRGHGDIGPIRRHTFERPGNGQDTGRAKVGPTEDPPPTLTRTNGPSVLHAQASLVRCHRDHRGSGVRHSLHEPPGATLPGPPDGGTGQGVLVLGVSLR
jgi:hypothetical protein